MIETLPHDVEMERAVLGAAVMDRTALYNIIDVLAPGDFYVEGHRQIYAAVVHLASCEDAAVDVVTVRRRLDETMMLDLVGGTVVLSELLDSTPDLVNARYYAQQVKDLATRRELIVLARNLQTRATAADSAKEALDETMSDIISIAGGAGHGSAQHSSVVAAKVIDDLEQVLAGNVSKVRVTSGLEEVDRKLLMRHGQVIVLAGGTGAGKSSLALQVADMVASRDQTVLYFSLEMSAEELTTRLLAARAEVPSDVIERNECTPYAIERLKAQVDPMSKARLYIDDTPNMTPLDCRARARQLQLRHGLDLVVVDYLQLTTPPGGNRSRNREQEVSAMSRAFKLTARALGVPLLLLSQLRRFEGNREPELRDLRESGAIENDADAVVFIHRPDLDRTEADLLIKKQRQGPLGKVGLVFKPKSTRFEEDPMRELEAWGFDECPGPPYNEEEEVEL